MKPKSTPPNPPPPAPHKAPLPALAGFIKAVTPQGEGPVRALTARFRENSRREFLQSYILPAPPKDSAEYFVELRIREWMMRKEREEAELRRRSKEREDARGRNPLSPPRP